MDTFSNEMGSMDICTNTEEFSKFLKHNSGFYANVFRCSDANFHKSSAYSEHTCKSRSGGPGENLFWSLESTLPI